MWDSVAAHLRWHSNLLLPYGFDEIRIAPLEEILPGAVFSGPGDYLEFRAVLELFYSLKCRSITSGLWYGFNPETLLNWAFLDGKILLVALNARESPGLLIGFDDILRCCESALTSPTEFGAIVLPNLWQQPDRHPRIELVDTTRDILFALKANEKDFSDLTWQQLEEIVAEILRSRGMEVKTTPRSADGGRDIIARGELIHGEPTVLAIEVKHKGIVHLDEIRSRLYANHQFPALMFATSGRFSAGVIQEKKKPENFLRLLLKDGLALSQWIADYGSRGQGRVRQG